jgi:NADPH:quinone reductase-like Zn-dependent oxidoreductase
MVPNSAVWLVAEKADRLELAIAPFTDPNDDQIVVRNHAVAINPIDGVIQKFAIFPLQYPAILGHDLAGVVEAVGPNVTRFKKGDRILGHAAGFANRSNAENAFQTYTLLQTNLVCEIPDNISFARAAVIPVGCSTAASAMFQKGFLNMALPTEPRRKLNGKVVLIWGGSSSVGSNAIQLGVASGYEVITVASPKNFDYVKRLGASQVFDYNSHTVVEEILGAFQGKALTGVLDCIGGSACWIPCCEVAKRSAGFKIVVTTKPGWPEPPKGVDIKFVQGTGLKNDEVGKSIFEDFLPSALESGAFIPAPDPLVAGEGLGSIQEAIHLQAKGMSAKKVIVLL